MIDYRFSHVGKERGVDYDQLFVKDTHASRIFILEKNILEKIYTLFLGDKEIDYLDFACGTGRVIQFIEDKVTTSCGVDVSDDMIILARKKCHHSKFYVSDITKNPLKLKKFDLITAFRFFLNAQPELRKKSLRVLRKLLKKDGILIFNIHGNKLSIDFLIKVILRKESRLNYRTYFQVKRELALQKFKIAMVFGVGYLPAYISAFIPFKLWLTIEKILLKVPFIKYFASDLVFVCCAKTSKNKWTD